MIDFNKQQFHKEGEVSEEVKVYYITMTCPKCKNGSMTFNNISIMSDPPCNEHLCTNCGCKKTYRGVTYPRIEYRKVGK